MIEYNTVADLRDTLSYNIFIYIYPVHVALVEGNLGNAAAFNTYIEAVFNLYKTYPGIQVLLVYPGGGDIVHLDLALDGGGFFFFFFNAYLAGLIDTFNALSWKQLYDYVPYVVEGPGVLAFNIYINLVRTQMKAIGISPTGHTGHDPTIDARDIVIADSDWRNNSQHVSYLVQFNQTYWCYNVNINAVDNNQINSMATYTNIIIYLLRCLHI